MGVLNIYHPDIKFFIEAKSSNAEKLKHFNLSVMVDNDFMNAVKNNSKIYLHFPVYNDNGTICKDESKWQIKKEVDAKSLWDEIMQKAYDNGEPGIFFYDNMNKDNNLYYIERIVGSNPCFTGDMKLLTVDGYKTFEELEGNSDISIINNDGNISKHNRVWCSGYKDIVKIKLSNGKHITCTPNHVFMLNDGTECEAKDLYEKHLKTITNEDIFVVSVENNGKERVYDFTENINHWGIVEDVVVHNCGEYLAGTLYGENPVTHEKLDPENYGGACNLGSLFLHNFVKNPFTKDASVDYDDLKLSIYRAVRMLDEVIDVNHFPDEVYENYQKSFRTIGLGTTGLADMLCMLNLKYNSKEALDFADNLYNFIVSTAYLASIELAKEKGSFPFFDKDKFIQSNFIQKHANYSNWDKVIDGIEKYGIRNAKIMSVAPTGTLSLTYGNNCSSGIEPIFCLSYDRKVKIGGQADENEQIVSLKDYAFAEWEKVKDNSDCIVAKDVFITAMEMTVDEHVDMLAKIAFHVDMSVSKTINVPTDYSFEDTKNIYMRCWENGIKGCTIFRPNELRQGVLLTNQNKKEEKKKQTSIELKRGDIILPSDDLISFKKTIRTGCGKFYLHLDFDETTGMPYETWIDCGGLGGCERNYNLITRLISLALRGGIPMEEIIDQCKSVRSCSAYRDRMHKYGDTSKGTSCPSAIGFALEELCKKIENIYVSSDLEIDLDEDNENIQLPSKIIEPIKTVEVKNIEETKELNDSTCPECGSHIEHIGGCVQCFNCGWSKCN